MKRNRLVILSAIYFLISVFITHLSASEQPGCYFCMNPGTPENYCHQASGSGWTGCEKGYLTCGFYGSSCKSE